MEKLQKNDYIYGYNKTFSPRNSVIFVSEENGGPFVAVTEGFKMDRNYMQVRIVLFEVNLPEFSNSNAVVMPVKYLTLVSISLEELQEIKTLRDFSKLYPELFI